MTATGLNLDEQARVDFALFLRRRWTDVLYPALSDQYRQQCEREGSPSGDSVEAVTTNLPVYPWFAWMERGAQKMLWRTVSDIVAAHPEEKIEDPEASPNLMLDPDLALPNWYTDWDIHVQPGGVWRNEASARVYELGAKLVMLGANDEYGFHTAFIETAIPKRNYRRIVDMGCGFGKSTWPLKKAFPEAEVIGIDLAGPCLQMAHHRSVERDMSIKFIQADASDTGLESESCDLVTATILIHEVPLDVLPAFFAECSRLLAPGGCLRILDFHKTSEPLRDLVMDQHGERNNEPFMPPMLNADLVEMCRDAGLENVQWVAFDERGAGRLDGLTWPDRPEWHFPWAVLEAEKPG